MSVRIQTADFDVAAEIASLTNGRDDIGAVVTFTGRVRGGEVTAMTLEHYPGMTEKALTAIESEAEKRWPLKASLIVHRVGRLQLQEASVSIVVTSAHRQAAYDASLEAINRLKKLAPIWKKEYFEDGEVWVGLQGG